MFKIRPHPCNADPKQKCDKCGNISRGECGRTLPAFDVVIE